VSPTLSREWIQETVYAIWGWRLEWFQLEDVYKLLSGGIYSVMYPTDFGKSTIIEIVVVLGTILDPNRRSIVVKINESAAAETSSELARKLEHAGKVLGLPAIKPMISFRNHEPFGVTKGFWCWGADHSGRNTNKSVHVYALGSRDLQGKRGPTLVDDVETQEEANSLAMRLQLEKRLSAVMRTLEDKPDALWAILGTPYHETSIHFDFVTKLRGLGVRYEEIRREPIQADGSPLWARREAKREIHRRTMSKTEYAAAYELRPVSSRRLKPEEIEALKILDWPIPKNEQAFRTWLYNRLMAERPVNRDPEMWEREVLVKLTKLELYVGWDPATTGDWANSVVAILGRHTYVLRSQLSVGDVWEQSIRVKGLYELFPSSSVIIEKNAQQKAFKDVFEKACPQAPVFGHGTYSNKESEAIGIPAFMAQIREGYLHIPWGDRESSEYEFSDLITELEQYGPTAHPHIIPSMWFCWYWSHKYEVEKPARKIANGEPPDEMERFKVLQPIPRTRKLRPSAYQQRAREAWTRHRR
jgi:hypothetical protein